MIRTHADRMTMISLAPPSAPRLLLEPTSSRRALLDGGWWPRSRDPVAELPGLILAIDARRGTITQVMLGMAGWDSHPRRLGVAGRVVRLAWFTTQHPHLLTAICGNDDRVDLLVVPAATDYATANAAMAIAAMPEGTRRAPDILPSAAVQASRRRPDPVSEADWETDGGRVNHALERSS